MGAREPGGKLAITTWGPRFFEPATSAFWNSIQKERSDLLQRLQPLDRICDPQSLNALFAEAGIAKADVAAESNLHPISSPEAWWAAVIGSGYRGTVDQLEAAARERVRAANLEFIRNSGTAFLEANVVCGSAEHMASHGQRTHSFIGSEVADCPLLDGHVPGQKETFAVVAHCRRSRQPILNLDQRLAASVAPRNQCLGNGTG